MIISTDITNPMFFVCYSLFVGSTILPLPTFKFYLHKFLLSFHEHNALFKFMLTWQEMLRMTIFPYCCSTKSFFIHYLHILSTRKTFKRFFFFFCYDDVCSLVVYVGTFCYCKIYRKENKVDHDLITLTF